MQLLYAKLPTTINSVVNINKLVTLIFDAVEAVLSFDLLARKKWNEH